MTVPIQIPWDMYQGQIVVWCECLRARARRAVLLPRLDTIFAPREEDPGRTTEYDRLDWRLVSPTEAEWGRYLELVHKQADRAKLSAYAQRIETVAAWAGGRQVAVPQYHLWLYADESVGGEIRRLYEEPAAQTRRELWQWLLAWTAPAAANTNKP